MEGNLARKRRGIKWFKFGKGRARAKLGNQTDDVDVVEDKEVNYNDSGAEDDTDDESFDVRVHHAATDPDATTQDAPSELELMADFFVDFGTCRCLDA